MENKHIWKFCGIWLLFNITATLIEPMLVFVTNLLFFVCIVLELPNIYKHHGK